jgi:hypothetical protein
MNATSRQKEKKKTYTLDEANAALPLLRVILRDITALAHELRERNERLISLQQIKGLDRAHEEEVHQIQSDFEAGQERMREYVLELENLGVELKDYFTGLIDFRHVRDGREVYLCWRLGEPEVAHWHELNAGFSGRKKLDALSPAS